MESNEWRLALDEDSDYVVNSDDWQHPIASMLYGETIMALVKPRKTDANQVVTDLLARRPEESENAEAVNVLRQRLKHYEVRYNLPSNRLHAALEAGELTETLDVCDWLIHYDMFLRAEAR